MKTCSKCGVTKKISDFPDDKRNKDGKTGYCRSCKLAAFNAWKSKNAEKAKRAVKEWRDNHKEHCSEYGKQYRLANKEHYRELSRKWKSEHKPLMRALYIKHREKSLEYYRKRKVENPEKLNEMRGRINREMRRAGKREKEMLQ